MRWATVHGADALGMNDRIGTLSPGKQADVIVAGGPGVGQHPVYDAAAGIAERVRATAGALPGTPEDGLSDLTALATANLAC
ncbi:hypothetical protein DMP17_24440 [Pseudonocardia sp. TMWB2A]